MLSVWGQGIKYQNQKCVASPWETSASSDCFTHQGRTNGAEGLHRGNWEEKKLSWKYTNNETNLCLFYNCNFLAVQISIRRTILGIKSAWMFWKVMLYIHGIGKVWWYPLGQTRSISGQVLLFVFSFLFDIFLKFPHTQQIINWKNLSLDVKSPGCLLVKIHLRKILVI